MILSKKNLWPGVQSNFQNKLRSTDKIKEQSKIQKQCRLSLLKMMLALSLQVD